MTSVATNKILLIGVTIMLIIIIIILVTVLVLFGMNYWSDAVNKKMIIAIMSMQLIALGISFILLIIIIIYVFNMNKTPETQEIQKMKNLSENNRGFYSRTSYSDDSQ